MSWFARFCRQSGLIVHHLIKPVPQAGHKQQVSRRVEERQVGQITLRRTTIEEIEVHPAPDGESDDPNRKAQ